MLYEPGNFLYMVKQLVTGTNGFLRGTTGARSFDGGIKEDITIPLPDIAAIPGTPITDSTGGTASTTFAAITAPAANATTSLTADMTAVKNALAEIALLLNRITLSTTDGSGLNVLSVPAGQSGGFAYVPFTLNRDYDEASDTLVVRIQAACAAGDAGLGIGLSGVLTYKKPGQANVTTAIVKATLPFNSSTASLSGTEATYEISFSGNGLTRDTIINVELINTVAGSAGAILIYGVEFLFDSTIVSYNDTDQSGIDGVLSEYGNPLR